MRKFSEYIKSLSLAQQLTVLIIAFISFFSVFFFVYINGNVKNAVKDEMFATLDHTQNIIESMSGYDQLPTNINGVSVYEVKIIDDYLVLEHDGTGISLKEQEAIKQAIRMLLNTSKNRVHGEFDNAYQGLDSFYSIYKSDDGHYILARTYSNSMQKLESILVNSVIYITIIAIGFFFLVMSAWVVTLIHPINLIKQYIEKIKAGDDSATLNVDRHDEIGELATAVVEMRSELQKQEKTKEEMIHNISHDLKTPIATIKSYAESIKDGIYPYGTLENSVDIIIENAERLEKKAHSLLYLNRVEYLISQNDKGSKTKIKPILEKVIQNSKVKRPELEIIAKLEDVEFDGISEPWTVAIENIFENALRYAQSKIEVNLNENELTIANDGECMEEDRIETLFKPFEKGKGGKFGLGLSIVAKVVHANGYEVRGENLTKGVIFRIFKKKTKINKH